MQIPYLSITSGSSVLTIQNTKDGNLTLGP